MMWHRILFHVDPMFNQIAAPDISFISGKHSSIGFQHRIQAFELRWRNSVFEFLQVREQINLIHLRLGGEIRRIARILLSV